MAAGAVMEYSSDDDVALVQDVIQQVLDDYGTGLLLVCDSDPGFRILPYEASFKTWQEGVTQLTDAIGWDWYRDGGRVVLFEPPRVETGFVHRWHIEWVEREGQN